ncbi:hypothetical protein [Neisseria yangbaofengii]|uniref:hypothetical protein n=1 Tax=Neisseria yangbaofengii TaxID=2709396 RepID=UPI001D029721|nr:hypothetical protein [Neisseria yangbaofengii]
MRIGQGKAFIRAQISERFGYDLNRTCDDVRPDYQPETFAKFPFPNNKDYLSYQVTFISPPNTQISPSFPKFPRILPPKRPISRVLPFQAAGAMRLSLFAASGKFKHTAFK